MKVRIGGDASVEEAEAIARAMATHAETAVSVYVGDADEPAATGEADRSPIEDDLGPTDREAGNPQEGGTEGAGVDDCAADGHRSVEGAEPLPALLAQQAPDPADAAVGEPEVGVREPTGVRPERGLASVNRGGRGLLHGTRLDPGENRSCGQSSAASSRST